MVTNRHIYMKETQSWKTVKEIDQQLLDFITINVLKIEQQHYSDQDIITIPMNPIIKSYSSKNPMSWKLIHFLLLHPSYSFMKAMCHHQTRTHLPKNCHKKLNQAPCTICYTEKMKTLPKRTTVDTTNLQPGELILIYFSFYNVTSICRFTFMLTVVCANTRILWVFHIVSKRSPVHIILFLLTTLKN